MADDSQQRVAKLMAARGLCSRREAERLIDAGCVLVDGEVVRQQGAKAADDARIEISGAGEALLGGRETVIVNKPIGLVSTQPEPGQTPAWTLITAATQRGAIDRAQRDQIIAAARELSVAGRLDRASRGLLVLTQDGTVARRIIGGNGVEKAYLVAVTPAPRDEQIRKLNGPLRLDGVALRPMRVTRAGAEGLRFVLVEGRKHQIRRCCRTVGLEVTDLQRIAVGPLRLGDLPEGCWRVVSTEEIELLQSDGRVSSRAEAKVPKASTQRRRGAESTEKRRR
ncbi:MAG: pseudouridine synthase [Deltaproteobacteria bacterium]|nr:pseudouridine synthase [Deltaproteobacteria bacterium]